MHGFLKKNSPHICMVILTLLTAYALKHHYSRAGSDELYWMLAPVAALTEAVSGIPFFYESRTGFISGDRWIVIAPSCAGINFMIMVFGCWMLAGVVRIQKTASQFLWWAAGLFAAYAIAVSVNAFRILISIHLYRANIYSEWITPERVHRAEGILIYFGALLIVYPLICRFLDHRKISPSGESCHRLPVPYSVHRILTASCGVPLIIYLGLTLLVPLFNGSGTIPLVFAEHGIAVLTGCAVVIFTGYLIKRMYRLFYRFSDIDLGKTMPSADGISALDHQP